MNESGIAWPSDLASKFKQPQTPVVNGSNAQAIAAHGPLSTFNITDEHFVVWMRTAALPDFRKLYARLPDVKKGTYTVRVDNNYDVSGFGGTKSLVLATTSWLG